MTSPQSSALVRVAGKVSRVVRVIAFLTAGLIATAPPLAYLLIQYDNLSREAETHAVTSANLVSRHLYGNSRLWQFELYRLEEILVRSNPHGAGLRQRVFESDGHLVIETGAVPESPTIVGRAAIRSRGRTVGTVEVELTLRPALVRTGVVALVCLALAAAMVVLVIVLPLRTLSAAVRSLGLTNQELVLARDALEQSSELIFITDAQGSIQYGNSRFDRSARRGGQQSLPATLAEFATRLNDIDPRSVQANLSRGEPWRERYAYVAEDRDTRQAEALCSPIRDAQGRVAHFVYVERDITEQVRLEAQLRDAQRMESLGKLAGGVAHDFNNILTPIMGYADMLLKGAAAGTTQHERLQSIATSARRARDLVSRILQFSRRTEDLRIPWQLTRTVEEVIPLLESTLPSNVRIAFHQDRRVELPPVAADPAQMNHLVMNLCANAGKAMPLGGELRIRLEAVDLTALRCIHGRVLSGRHVSLVVEDTGVGMDAPTLSRAFEPFFTTREPGAGTGLGLATVYGAVQRHQGGIIATSEPGRGSTFAVYLPALEDSSGAIPSEEPAAEAGVGTILIVDDEPGVAAVFESVLEDFGYRVVTTSDPCVALEWFRVAPHRFDLLITDRTMPHLSGEDLIRAVRRLRADLPIILCTGYSDTIGTTQVRALGISRLVSKPIGADELGNLVTEVLALDRQATRDPSPLAHI